MKCAKWSAQRENKNKRKTKECPKWCGEKQTPKSSRSRLNIVTKREELSVIYDRHRRDAKTRDTPALTLADLRAKDWCLCYAAIEAPLYTTWRANLIGKTPKDGYCLVCVRWRGHVLDL